MKIIERENLFELLSDKGEVIGEMAYMPMNNSIIITHTGVSLDYRGQGLAEKLVLSRNPKSKTRTIKIRSHLPLCRQIFQRTQRRIN